MATLAISAVGAVVGGVLGGPFGASIGWALGGLAGNALFPPRGQDSTGPRLSDLSVQSSAYGTGIPVLFGTMRLAGNILWASGIQETTNRRRVGKGGPRATATTFSYSASWAVGFCEGPASAVRRIWFDEKLVYDASGASLQVEVPGLTWRFYPGDEAQLPDPLIEAAVGAANAVAHRGLCYLVFDNVPLERLGNRVPNVTAEIVMAGSTSATVDSITRPDGTYTQLLQAANWSRGRIYSWRQADFSIIATDAATLTSSVLAALPSVGSGIGHVLLAADGCVWVQAVLGASLTQPIHKVDEASGAIIGTFGGSVFSSSNGVTNIIPASNLRQNALVQVVGATGTRNFLLLSFVGGTTTGSYAIDADSMTYLWGSASTGHPVLFTATSGGQWVQGEQRAGATDAHYLVGVGSAIQWWTVTITEGAKGVASGPGIGSTLGVVARRQADITAASLGHAAGAVTIAASWYDAEDAGLLVMSLVGSTYRLSKITPAGVVVWTVPGTFTQSATSHSSRLRGGTLAVHRQTNSVDVYDTRTGARTTSSTGLATSGSGFQLYDSDTGALYMPITGGGASFRRILTGRVTSSSVPLSSVVGALCSRAGLPAPDLNASALTAPLAGYVVARPTSARSAITPLAAAYLFDAVESDDALLFRNRGGASVMTVAHADLARNGEQGVIVETRAQDRELPRSLIVRHVDPARGYEAGAQQWQRPQAPIATMRSADAQTLDLPLALTAAEAKASARRLLTATWRERVRYNFAGTTQHLRLEPADPITLALADGSTVRARLASVQFGADLTLRMEAVAEAASDYALTAAADGGSGRAPDTLPAPYATRGFAPNLPLLADADDAGGTGLRAYLLAGGYAGQTWRGAAAWQLAGTAYDLLGTVPGNAAHGSVPAGLAMPASYWTWDEANTMTVVPINGASRIVSATELEVLDGANLGALIGPAGVVEVIQHQTATVNSDGSITLSRLLRGRRGTEDGGAFGPCTYILLDGSELRIISALAALNGSESFRFPGVFETVEQVATTTRPVAGRAERPFAPASIRGTRDGSNNLTITWLRRTRIGGEWLDRTGDVPLGETSEAYEVEIRNAGDTTTLRTITGLATPSASYTAAQQVTDFGSAQASVNVRIFQISATVGRGIAGRASI